MGRAGASSGHYGNNCASSCNYGNHCAGSSDLNASSCGGNICTNANGRADADACNDNGRTRSLRDFRTSTGHGCTNASDDHGSADDNDGSTHGGLHDHGSADDNDGSTCVGHQLWTPTNDFVRKHTAEIHMQLDRLIYEFCRAQLRASVSLRLIFAKTWKSYQTQSRVD